MGIVTMTIANAKSDLFDANAELADAQQRVAKAKVKVDVANANVDEANEKVAQREGELRTAEADLENARERQRAARDAETRSWTASFAEQLRARQAAALAAQASAAAVLVRNAANDALAEARVPQRSAQRLAEEDLTALAEAEKALAEAYRLVFERTVVFILVAELKAALMVG